MYKFAYAANNTESRQMFGEESATHTLAKFMLRRLVTKREIYRPKYHTPNI
jgi:hypothetical protein